MNLSFVPFVGYKHCHMRLPGPHVELHAHRFAAGFPDDRYVRFDAQDRTVLWNEHFLRFFPEHADHIHAGEPYQENLRRFTACACQQNLRPR